MEIKDIGSGKPSLSLENLGKPLEGVGGEALQIGKEKIESLQNAIKEIESLVKHRALLSKGINNDAEKIKSEINTFLMNQNEDSMDSDERKERIALKNKQVEICELQLNEKVNCWRDVANLKKELRDKQRELTEKEDRMSMLDKILE